MDECNWKIVPNTVTKRMVDSSFVHKLAPTKRLCRRTKVMNTAIRHLHNFKHYKQYVDMKTAVLRNLSEDDDTDDNNDLSDNDYNVLYKSDVDLTNSMIDITNTSSHYSESESDVSNYNISDITNQIPNAEQSKNNSSSSTVNLGWQKVVKRKPNELHETSNYESSESSSEEDVCEKNIRESKPNKLNETNNNESSGSSSGKVVCKKKIRASKQNELHETSNYESSASSSEEIVCKKKIRASKPNELHETSNYKSSASSSEEIVCKKKIRASKPNELHKTSNYESSAGSSEKVVCKKNIRESKPNELNKTNNNESSASSSEKVVCKKKIRESKPNELHETSNYESSASSSEKVVCKKKIRESKSNELNKTNNNGSSGSSSEKVVCKKKIRESKSNGPSASSSEKVVCKKQIQESKPSEPSASSSDKIVSKKNIRKNKPNELNETNNYESSVTSFEKVACKKEILESIPNESSPNRSEKVVCKKEIRESKPSEPSASSSDKIVSKKNIRKNKPNELNETNNYESSVTSFEKVACKKEILESIPNESSPNRSEKVVCKKEIRESKPSEPSASSSDKIVSKKNIRKNKPNELNETNNYESSVTSFEKVACKKEILENIPNESSPNRSEKVVCKKEIRESKANELNETNNYEPFANSSKKAVCKKDGASPRLMTCSKSMYSNKKTNGINTKQGTNTYYTKSSEGVSDSSNDEVKEKLNKSKCSKTLESKGKLNGIRKDLISFLDEETMVQHDDKHSVKTEICIRESCSRLKVEYVNVREVSTDENKSSESLLMQPPFNGNTNHPKDSGIDEDTEEEFHDVGRIVYAKKKKKMPEICINPKLTSPVLNHKNASTIETTLSNADDLLSDTHDISDTTDLKCTTLLTNEVTNTESKEENKFQKAKSQPKVTCTKVIKNRYRIISDNSLLLDKCSELSVSDDHINSKAMDPVNIKHNTEDSMSPLSKRRLQQMRRLNLTGDSESSPSDDDNEYCNTENMRDKLFKRSKEPCDLSNSEDENMGFKHSLSLENNKKLNAHGNSRFGKNRIKNIHSRESYTDNESVQSSKRSSNDYKDTSSETEMYLSADQYETNTRNSFEQSNETLCSSNESDSAKENTKHERLSQKHQQTKRVSKTDETATRTIMKNSVLQTRPHNLQELIDKESLVYETTLPSITQKDLQENNIFLLDIPSMVVENKLLGRKFILTESKLKLGKHKYKITLNDADHMSCVLNTGEACTDYKAVNFKPMKKFIAYEKIVKTAK